MLSALALEYLRAPPRPVDELLAKITGRPLRRTRGRPAAAWAVRDLGIDLAMRELAPSVPSQSARFRIIWREIPTMTNPRSVGQAWRRRGCGRLLREYDARAAARAATVAAALARERAFAEAVAAIFSRPAIFVARQGGRARQ